MSLRAPGRAYLSPMFIPIGDDNSRRRSFPLAVYAILAVNLYVWFLELRLGESFTASYAAVPLELSRGIDITETQYLTIHGEELPIPQGPGPHPIYLTALSAMFMHASWLHLIGNMIYLLIFGDQIEDRLGHLRFLLFYLVAGLAATALQVYATPTSILPTLGASGAIAGILGAYLILHPTNRVRVLLIRDIVALPAFFVLGMWVLLQFVGQATSPAEQGGVAYMAHIGGLLVGLVTGTYMRIYPSTRRHRTFT